MSLAADQSNRPVLKRKLGLLDATSIGLGAIIGAGIFVVMGVATGMAGPAVFISVIISGISAAFTALSFAELGATMPKAGGVYEYAHEMVSHPMGFLTGWVWLTGNIVLGATASLGFGYYLSSAFEFMPVKVGALAVIALVMFFNTIGVKRSALLNDFLVLAKIGVLIAFVLVGLPKLQLSHFNNLFPNGIYPVIQAAGLFYFAYIGFPRIATTAEEVKNPQKTIPQAIVLALAASSVIYLLTSITAVGLVGYEALGNSPTPIADASDAIGLRSVVELGALLATFSVNLTSVMGQSRIFFAMARNGEMPYVLSRIHERFDTPVYSIVLSGAAIVVLAMTVDLAGLASLGSACVLFTHLLTNYSAFRLYRSKPDKEAAFKAPLRPLHAIVGGLLSLLLLLGLGADTLIAGIIVSVLGCASYFAYTKYLQTREMGR